MMASFKYMLAALAVLALCASSEARARGGSESREAGRREDESREAGPRGESREQGRRDESSEESRGLFGRLAGHFREMMDSREGGRSRSGEMGRDSSSSSSSSEERDRMMTPIPCSLVSANSNETRACPDMFFCDVERAMDISANMIQYRIAVCMPDFQRMHDEMPEMECMDTDNSVCVTVTLADGREVRLPGDAMGALTLASFGMDEGMRGSGDGMRGSGDGMMSGDDGMMSGDDGMMSGDRPAPSP